MLHRLAQISDCDRIMEIIRDAQDFLKESGVDQWQNGYPSKEICENDIRNGNCYVFIEESEIEGVISIIFETEESYSAIEDGKWLTNDAPYAVIHRAAVSNESRGKKVSSYLISLAENMSLEHGVKSLRVDTHNDNKAMRGLLEKHGFVYCGKIYLNSERTAQNERVCYEKLL